MLKIQRQLAHLLVILLEILESRLSNQDVSVEISGIMFGAVEWFEIFNWGS
jgi:hypothetical protein